MDISLYNEACSRLHNGEDTDRAQFDLIHKAIVDKKLFLDPLFSRSKYIKLGLVNKNKAAQLLKKYAGTNLNGYINGMRLDYAARMMHEHPEDPMKAIAVNAGFNSMRTFYRLFLSKYGETPSDYKKKIMRLRIADWDMGVVCGSEAMEYLRNFTPFVVPDGDTRKASFICRIETGCVLTPESTAPVMTNVLDGKTLRLWLSPDSCVMSLTFHDSMHTYWLRADREWHCAQADWSPAGVESYVALNDIIMLSFIYSSAFRHTVIIHASCVSVNDEGCAFIGPSGIGKSTHSRLWMQHIPGVRLLNDDQPVLRLMPDGTIRVYGSPWSGKEPCYKNEGVRLKAMFFMEQSDVNQVVPLDGIQAFSKLLKATSLIGRDTVSFAAISGTQATVAGAVPSFLLKNRPDRDAAYMCYHAFVST